MELYAVAKPGFEYLYCTVVKNILYYIYRHVLTRNRLIKRVRTEKIRAEGEDRLLCTEEDPVTRADATKQIVWTEKAQQLAASFHVSLGHVGADNLFKHVSISPSQYLCMK